MKVYKIQTPFNYSQVHCVIAENLAEAEKLYLKEYPNADIIETELISKYVIVAPPKLMQKETSKD